MKIKATILLVFLGGLAIHAGRQYWLQSHDNDQTGALASRQPAQSQSADIVETEHYEIASTAAPLQTMRVAEAVERLYGAYTTFFDGSFEVAKAQPKLKLVLYKDQKEFKAHNKSSPWAEAFYLPPSCHAYYAEGSANPYHWMLHEATHQLGNEVAHFRKSKWIDEGLATYFGASMIQHGELVPGTIDPNAYPIWWLSSLVLTGNLQDDIRNGRIIPLRSLISGTGPDIGLHVNLYYIEYWSLSHFLFHFEEGRYAGKYKELIASNGSLEEFERIVGPTEQIQLEWYLYLKLKITEAIVSQPTQIAR